MIKHEQGNVQREDINFGRDALAWALWRLSLVLRDIAATDDRAEKPKNIEKKEPPPQAPGEDTLAGGAEEDSSHASE